MTIHFSAIDSAMLPTSVLLVQQGGRNIIKRSSFPITLVPVLGAGIRPDSDIEQPGMAVGERMSGELLSNGRQLHFPHLPVDLFSA
ncbi:hypothetical protein [Paracidovorax oryzae]|uniref:hypothetical protein n=1 Tax=Paracidovorax oryzae TaxID=862720 RepID=UPI0035D0C8B1